MATHFSEASVRFLRGLARHNDREWFEARRAVFEGEVKAPMLEAIAEINLALARFAPEHVRPPAKAMMRIYRDIRFSPNKQPYKTHAAAWWARKGLEKTSGGGFYLEFGPDGLRVAGGAYMPEKDQLLAIRRHLVAHHERYRKLMAAKKMRALMTPLEPMLMARGPKGFEHAGPATDLILQRQWGASADLPLAAALEPGMVKTIVERMEVAAPLVEFLNEPLARRSDPKPLF